MAVNNKIEVVDVFGSTPLFRKVWPKLLKGYALDAAVAAANKSKKTNPPPTLKDAEKFLRDAMESQVKDKTKGEEGLVVTKRESDASPPIRLRRSLKSTGRRHGWFRRQRAWLRLFQVSSAS